MHLMISGIGPLVASSMLAAIGSDPRWFDNGRGLVAFLGLMPRQHSTGGRETDCSASASAATPFCATCRP